MKLSEVKTNFRIECQFIKNHCKVISLQLIKINEKKSIEHFRADILNCI